MKMQSLLLVSLACLAAQNAASADEISGRLKTIKDRNYITVAYRESSIPFSYLDGKGQPIGYAQDICAKIVEAIQLKIDAPQLEIRRQAVTSQNRIPLLQNGTVDMECGTTVNNPERQSAVSFSTTYFVVGTRFVSRKADKLNTLDDLKGRTVVATTGSNIVGRVRALDRKEGLNLRLVQAKDFSDSMLTFASGRAAAFFEDDINLVGQIAFHPNPEQYALSRDELSRDPYAVMLPRDEPAFKAIADTTIQQLFRSGEIHALYAKWFMQPIPPRGVNLQFPMGEPLRKLIAHPTDSPNPADY